MLTSDSWLLTSGLSLVPQGDEGIGAGGAEGRREDGDQDASKRGGQAPEIGWLDAEQLRSEIAGQAEAGAGRIAERGIYRRPRGLPEVVIAGIGNHSDYLLRDRIGIVAKLVETLADGVSPG